jgi:hypothetical protein
LLDYLETPGAAIFALNANYSYFSEKRKEFALENTFLFIYLDEELLELKY